MANTTSLKWPNMFDVSRNKVTVVEDNQSVVNRTKLLLLTEPTELFMNPDFGVGLRRHLFQYNTENQKAIIKDRIIKQLRLHEPCVVPEDTVLADGLIFTGDQNDPEQKYNKLELTCQLATTFGDQLEVTLNGDI